jgi:hypothetical protein
VLKACLLEAGLLEAGQQETGLQGAEAGLLEVEPVLEARLVVAGLLEAGLLAAGQREVGLTFMYLSKPNMVGEGVYDLFTSGVSEKWPSPYLPHCSAITCSSRSPSARASA